MILLSPEYDFCHFVTGIFISVYRCYKQDGFFCAFSLENGIGFGVGGYFNLTIKK